MSYFDADYEIEDALACEREEWAEGFIEEAREEETPGDATKQSPGGRPYGRNVKERPCLQQH